MAEYSYCVFECLSSRPPTVQQEVDRQEAADVHCSLQGPVWWSRVLANVNMLLHPALCFKNNQFNLFVWQQCRWTAVNMPASCFKTVGNRVVTSPHGDVMQTDGRKASLPQRDGTELQSHPADAR